MLERSFVTHEYEHADILRFIDLIHRNNGTFFDVGANMGIYSLLACKWGQFTSIVAVEPSKREVTILEHNFKLNRLRHYTIVQAAASNKNGTAMLNIADRFHRGENTLGPFVYSTTKLAARIPVPTKTLDQIAMRLCIAKVTLIKVDTDGHEYQVIRGGEKIIKRDRPFLLVEFPSTQLVDLLRKWNYTPDDASGFYNTLFTPNHS